LTYEQRQLSLDAVNLNELIEAVEESGAGDPLERVAAAATIKDQVAAIGDELVDHFVAQARAAGCSWTQIGEALGVTRQAAQQRSGGPIGRLLHGLTRGRFTRFTKRAKAAVIAAQAVARDRRDATVETHHLLLGLFAGDDGNVAVTALAHLGVDRAAVERAIDARVAPGTDAPRGHVPFGAQAKKTLELTLREALRMGHNYIGCEHIVLALRRIEDGLAAQILAELGVTYADLEKAVRERLAEEADVTSRR
jgi:ClpA/ClpB-like protein